MDGDKQAPWWAVVLALSLGMLAIILAIKLIMIVAPLGPTGAVP